MKWHPEAIVYLATQRITGWPIWIIIALGVVSLVLAGLPRRTQPWPPTADQPFSSWNDAWVIPHRPAGDHMILLAYFKQDGGRLPEPLKVAVVDVTDGTRPPQGPDNSTIGPYDDWEVQIVAYFEATEGHSYRIEVDPDQVKSLARYRHKLWVDMTPIEKMNWAERKNPNWLEERKAREAEKAKKKKEWEPGELKKARAIKKAWEAEKARMRGEREASSP